MCLMRTVQSGVLLKTSVEEIMKIALRMDDITADMNWDNFFRLKELFDKAGVRPLLGVVPNYLCGGRRRNVETGCPAKGESISGGQAER